MASANDGKKITKKVKIVKDYQSQYVGHRFSCNCCGKLLAVADNYFKVPENKLCSENIFPVCKKCLKEEFARLRFEYGDKNAFKILLRKMDRPYIEELVTGALEKDNENPLPHLMRQLSGFKQYINLNYDDSDYLVDRSKTVVDDFGIINEKLDKLEEDDWVRWQGWGLAADEFSYCKNFYDNIMSKYEFSGVNEEMSVQQLAVAQVKLKKAFKENDANNISSLRKTISSIESDLNISSRQKKEDIEKDTFGNFIKRIEEEEPIPKATEEFEDVDNIWKLVKRYILGYLSVMMGKAREQDVLQEDTDILDKYNPNLEDIRPKEKEDTDE